MELLKKGAIINGFVETKPKECNVYECNRYSARTCPNLCNIVIEPF